MKPILLTALLASLLMASAQAAPDPAAVQASQQRAIQKYPDLGKQGSVFNRRFLEVLAEWKQSINSRALENADWPMWVADQTAMRLAEDAAPRPRPGPSAPLAEDAAPRPRPSAAPEPTRPAVVVDDARRRIGETREECIARYGQAISEKNGMTAFTRNGLLIGVMFYEEKADAIYYTKSAGKPLPGPEDKLSDVEIEALLKANSPGEWKELSSGFHPQWQSEDGELMAQKEIFEGALMVMSKAYVLRTAEEKKAKELRNLKGL